MNFRRYSSLCIWQKTYFRGRPHEIYYRHPVRRKQSYISFWPDGERNNFICTNFRDVRECLYPLNRAALNGQNLYVKKLASSVRESLSRWKFILAKVLPIQLYIRFKNLQIVIIFTDFEWRFWQNIEIPKNRGTFFFFFYKYSTHTELYFFPLLNDYSLMI